MTNLLGLLDSGGEALGNVLLFLLYLITAASCLFNLTARGGQLK